METFLRETDALERAELLTWNVSPDGVEYALFHLEGDVDRYRARIDEVGSVRAYTLTPVDAGSFYAYVEQRTRDAERELRTAFARRSLVVVPPVVYDESGMTVTVVGEATDLRAMLDDLPDDLAATIGAVGDFDRRHGTLGAPLTGRQREAVERAVDLGYYEVPREASLEAVAAALDCAPSTASTHLRKAERAVMTRLV
jgi:predicted DNA binding protein